MKRLRHYIYFYERAMFYAGQAISEARKPLLLLNETLLVATWLKVYGYGVSWKWMAIIYLILFIIAIIIGRILKVTGVIAYTNEVNSREVPQMMEIIERLKRIEEKSK